jgi:hypothetical protein
MKNHLPFNCLCARLKSLGHRVMGSPASGQYDISVGMVMWRIIRGSHLEAAPPAPPAASAHCRSSLYSRQTRLRLTGFT